MSKLSLALALALSALAYPAANAADGGAAQPSQASGMASMQTNCGNMMPRHDHGADKGTPTAGSAMKCPMGTADVAAAATAKAQPKTRATAKRGHDHARTHKLM